jgi:hypothetical protein
VYLAQPDPDGDRLLDEITFDEESLTALDGTLVWKALAARDKVFDRGQFTAQALVHNLRESDYGRTLSDIRSAFYSAPRLPLLHAGDRDLQQAVYEAAQAGLLSIIDSAGNEVAVTLPGQVNLVSTGLRLAKPKPKVTTCPSCGGPDHTGQPCAGATTATPGAGDSDSADGRSRGRGRVLVIWLGGDSQGSGVSPSVTSNEATEQQVGVSSPELLNNTDDADRFAVFSRRSSSHSTNARSATYTDSRSSARRASFTFSSEADALGSN